MISIRYTLTRSLAGMPGTAVVQTRHVQAEEAGDALVADVKAALKAWGPEEIGDETRFSLDSARHVHLGVETFPCRRRVLRRAGERAWPDRHATPGSYVPSQKAAYFLLTEGACVARMSPFTGITVTRF